MRKPISRSPSKSSKSKRGFLKRMGSKRKKNIRPVSSASDEANLFMSDMVTKEYCIENLTDVKEDAAVVKMRIEDLLVSQHQSLVPVVKSLIFFGTREWEWIRFDDTVDCDDFALWHEKKQAMMQNMEATVDDTSRFKNVVSYKPTVRISRGTQYYVVRSILEAIHQDATVFKVVLEFSLDVEDTLQPAMLKKLVDPQTGELLDELTLCLECGWSDTPLPQESKKVLEEGILALQSLGPVRSTLRRAPVRNASMPLRKREPQSSPCLSTLRGSTSPMRRVQSVSVTGARPRMPKRTMRRTKSVADDGPRGPLPPTVSMRTTDTTKTRPRIFERSVRRIKSGDDDGPPAPPARTASMPLKKRDPASSPSLQTLYGSRTSPMRRVASATSGGTYPRMPNRNMRWSKSADDDGVGTRPRMSERSMRRTKSVDDDGPLFPTVPMSLGKRESERQRATGRWQRNTARSPSPTQSDGGSPRRNRSPSPPRRHSSPVPSRTGDAPPSSTQRRNSMDCSRKALPRRTKSFHSSSNEQKETADYDWAASKPTDYKVTPDYDWKLGAYLSPLASTPMAA